MIITREIDYAVRILRRLRDGRLCPVPEIAKDTVVPKLFAYKILKKLENAGLVVSAQGPRGGYRLVADLSRYTLYDVIVSFHGNRLVTSCMDPRWQCEWRERHGRCIVHENLNLLQGQIDDLLKSYTLDTLIGPEQEEGAKSI